MGAGAPGSAVPAGRQARSTGAPRTVPRAHRARSTSGAGDAVAGAVATPAAAAAADRAGARTARAAVRGTDRPAREHTAAPATAADARRPAVTARAVRLAALPNVGVAAGAVAAGRTEAARASTPAAPPLPVSPPPPPPARDHQRCGARPDDRGPATSPAAKERGAGPRRRHHHHRNRQPRRPRWTKGPRGAADDHGQRAARRHATRPVTDAPAPPVDVVCEAPTRPAGAEPCSLNPRCRPGSHSPPRTVRVPAGAAAVVTSQSRSRRAPAPASHPPCPRRSARSAPPQPAPRPHRVPRRSAGGGDRAQTGTRHPQSHPRPPLARGPHGISGATVGPGSPRQPGRAPPARRAPRQPPGGSRLRASHQATGIR